jgi:hypothetical protein
LLGTDTINACQINGIYIEWSLLIGIMYDELLGVKFCCLHIVQLVDDQQLFGLNIDLLKGHHG